VKSRACFFPPFFLLFLEKIRGRPVLLQQRKVSPPLFFPLRDEKEKDRFPPPFFLLTKRWRTPSFFSSLREEIEPPPSFLFYGPEFPPPLSFFFPFFSSNRATRRKKDRRLTFRSMKGRKTFLLPSPLLSLSPYASRRRRKDGTCKLFFPEPTRTPPPPFPLSKERKRPDEVRKSSLLFLFLRIHTPPSFPFLFDRRRNVRKRSPLPFSEGEIPLSEKDGESLLLQ